MADESLQWMFDMAGDMAGQAVTNADAVERLGFQLDNAAKASKRLDSFFEHLGKVGAKAAADQVTRNAQAAAALANAQAVAAASVAQLTERMQEQAGVANAQMFALANQGLGMAKDAAVSLVHTLVEGFKEALRLGAELTGEIVKASAGRQKLDLAFRTSMGEREAGDLLGYIAGIAGKTEFDDDEIAKAILPLVSAGMKGPQLEKALIAGLDLTTRWNAGIEGVGSAMNAFERVLLTGHVDARVLRSLGIKADDYFDNLSKLMGGTRKDLEKAINAGKIKSDTLLSVIYQTIAGREGGVLGNNAIRSADTVAAKLHKLSQLPENFFKAFKDSEGFARFDALLGRLLEAIDPDGPGGQRLIKAVDRIFTKVMTWLERLAEPESIDRLVDGFESAIGVVGALVDMLIVGATALKQMVELSFQLARATAPLFGGKSSEETALDQLIVGFQRGTVDQAQIEAAIGQHGDAIIDAYKKKFEIHSPSRVMERLGAQVAAGFAEGVGGNSGAPPSEIAVRAPAGGAGGIHVAIGPIEIHATPGMSAQELADEVKSRLQELTPRMVEQILEQLALEEGSGN